MGKNIPTRAMEKIRKVFVIYKATCSEILIWGCRNNFVSNETLYLEYWAVGTIRFYVKSHLFSTGSQKTISIQP